MGADHKIGDFRLPKFLAVWLALCLACFWLLGTAVPVYRGRISSPARSNFGAPRFQLFRSPDLPAFSQRPLLIARPLFPYSIIPGGIESRRELQNAMAHDPVVASHYADFDLPNACIARNDHNRSVYVSYRLGDKIFWTKNPLALAKGELIITDGRHIARARCGNRVSEKPIEPISPAEPQPEALETAQNPATLNEQSPAFELPLEPPPGTSIQVAEHHRMIFFPPLIPVYFGEPSPGPIIPLTPPPSTSPTPTPEPGTLFLVGAGFSTAWLLRNASRS